MVRVRAEFPNADHRLRPGMFVDVEAVEESTESVIVLPETAITYSPYGNSVFVVSAKEKGLTVERRQIETGVSRNGEIAVLKGLQGDEQVVAVGQNKLRNGMPVEIVEDNVLSPHQSTAP
jgi:membrane fusion protein (multidrug efflux system)